jgi:DNA-binding transcriptional ArsR family regulator
MTAALPLADRFQALADPTRLRIVALLRSMELSVGELAQVLGQSQPRVSRHLKILADAGVLERRKEGSWVFLTLADAERVEPLFDLIDGWADPATHALFASDAARTDAIRAERAEAASRHFAAIAEVWDQIRSLHVAESDVERAIGRALAQRPLGRLVDVGTGTGRMLELFGPRASEAVGIDRSSEMLRLARVKLEAAGIASSLRQGDMYALPLADGSTDSVIIHQVLHYAHSPARGACLRPGACCWSWISRPTGARSCAPPTRTSASASRTRRWPAGLHRRASRSTKSAISTAAN